MASLLCFSNYMSEIWHHGNVFWTCVADSKKKKIVRENVWQWYCMIKGVYNNNCIVYDNSSELNWENNEAS